MTTAEFIDKIGIQPWFINLQFGVGQQTVTIETFNIVTFIGATVTPDITPSSFMAATSMVPVTARPSGWY
ncbi:hypothetical protein ACNKHK_20515 [Shigella flexneri]